MSQSASLTEHTGTLVVGGQTFPITQQAVTCSFAVTPTSFTNSAAGFTNLITVSAPAPCWAVENTNSWISIVSGSNGLGAGVVQLALAANAIALERTGTVVAAGQAVTILQQGIACTFTVSPTRRTHGFGTASNSFTINAGTGCLWSVVNTNPWLTIVGSGTGSGTNTVGYLVAANPSPLERIGYLNVQGDPAHHATRQHLHVHARPDESPPHVRWRHHDRERHGRGWLCVDSHHLRRVDFADHAQRHRQRLFRRGDGTKLVRSCENGRRSPARCYPSVKRPTWVDLFYVRWMSPCPDRCPSA